MEQSYICITGASSGIGQALAQYYDQYSEYSLILSARNQHAKDTLEKDFPEAFVYRADFSLPDSGKQFAQHLRGKNIIYCILSAGAGDYGIFGDMDIAQISELFQVNTLSPLELIHSCLGEFEKNHTKIVYVSSVIADMAVKNMGVYGATKHSMNYALKVLSLEYPKMRILNLHLGAIQTPMHISSGMGEMKGRSLKRVIPKLTKAIDSITGDTYIYPDWWIASHIAGPCISLFNTIKKIGKKF